MIIDGNMGGIRNQNEAKFNVLHPKGFHSVKLLCSQGGATHKHT